ncbi:hypothetical protein BGX30_004974 [Mortierella sp. GBA39]|nr:hypothetical protein BGX30_004974 [Mortierella sp. GBA39]
MVEDMVEMVGKVFGLKQQKKYAEALWEIDDLLSKNFRLNTRLLNSLSVEDIIDMFRLSGGVEADKLQTVARLLQEEGGVYKDMGEADEALRRFMKSLHLYLYADLNGAQRSMLQLQDRVAELKDEVKGYRLPVKTEKILLSYEEKEGRFDEAENVLFRLLDQREITEEEALRKLIHDIIGESTLITATLSQLRKREGISFTKVQIKPVELKKKVHYQLAYVHPNKVVHQNLTAAEAEQTIIELFEQTFRQALICTPEADYQILISKKYKVSILTKSPTKTTADLAHNRKKHYVLEEGEPVPFLVELGIMNEQGKVLARKYDKFKQINRFLEMERRVLNVVGLDLKADVIEHCSMLAEKLEYQNLRFLVGDIADYDELEQVDMVVTLHACDTATDAALEKAVRWNAQVILSVPCCQHELFSQVKNDALSPLLSHGILKERFSALATDAIRAKLLDLMGYKTQLLEFIDLEHTPKNILIRAVKGSSGNRNQLWQEYTAFRDMLSASPYLEKACADLLPEGSLRQEQEENGTRQS